LENAMGKTPDGFHTLTPHITVSDGEAAIALYEKALGAELVGKMKNPATGKIMHACLQTGSSKLFLNDSMPTPEAGANFYVYVEDVDAQHRQAVAAGMTEIEAPADMFWGDRIGNVKDTFGQHWSIATKQRDVSPEEMAEAIKKFAG